MADQKEDIVVPAGPSMGRELAILDSILQGGAVVMEVNLQEESVRETGDAKGNKKRKKRKREDMERAAAAAANVVEVGAEDEEERVVKGGQSVSETSKTT